MKVETLICILNSKIVATHFFFTNFIITFPFNFKYLCAEVLIVVEHYQELIKYGN